MRRRLLTALATSAFTAVAAVPAFAEDIEGDNGDNRLAGTAEDDHITGRGDTIGCSGAAVPTCSAATAARTCRSAPRVRTEAAAVPAWTDCRAAAATTGCTAVATTTCCAVTPAAEGETGGGGAVLESLIVERTPSIVIRRIGLMGHRSGFLQYRYAFFAHNICLPRRLWRGASTTRTRRP